MASKSNCSSDVCASFASAFRSWRVKNNIPLKKIAHDLGISIATVNSWELGKRFPTGYNFEMLVNYSGVPPCKLLCVKADKCVPDECQLVARKVPEYADPAPL